MKQKTLEAGNYAYNGDVYLKRAGVKLQLTEEQLKEFLKCANDPIYFIRNYMKIVHVDGGLVPFDMYDYQEEMVNHIVKNRFVSICCARQVGKSTVTCGFFLWYIIFHEHKKCAILANKKGTSMEILERVQLAYKNLPLWMQQGVVSWNKSIIDLENGSKIEAHAASASSIRGKSFSMVFVDEVAFVEPNIWDRYYKSSYPTISSGTSTKFILVSTPNGLNHFYTIHNAARNKRNSFAPFEVPWNRVPGRDEAWKQETINNTSVEAFRQEHECEFLGNSLTLIKSEVLRNLLAKTPIYKSGKEDTFKAYHAPEKGHTYCITVDTARGVGGDHSAFSVIDITTYPFKQVAVYRDNKISTVMYPDIIHQAALSYNNAFIWIELNDMGESIAHALQQELEYDNVLTHKDGTRVKFGLTVNKKTKRIGCNVFKNLVESYKLEICDEETINELYQFQEQTNGTFEAAFGHDDIVMGLVNFAYYTNTVDFNLLTDKNIRAEMQTYYQEQVEEDLVPFGAIDDGIESAAPTDLPITQALDDFDKGFFG